MEIMPTNELRNNYTEMSQLAKSLDEPIFLTKNGYADGVYMSVETYKKQNAKNKLHDTLLERELDLQANGELYSLSDTVKEIRERLLGKADV